MADVSADTTQLWCTDTTDPDSNTLKVTPPDSVKDTGLLRNTPFARVWHNFYFNYLCNSISWMFEERYKIGSIVTFKNTLAPDFLSWRGTWVYIGASTVGAVTVNFYERTA